MRVVHGAVVLLVAVVLMRRRVCLFGRTSERRKLVMVGRGLRCARVSVGFGRWGSRAGERRGGRKARPSSAVEMPPPQSGRCSRGVSR